MLMRLRNLLRGLLVVTVMTAGTALFTASPATAAGNCNGLRPISACVNFNPGATQARADFYMNSSLGNTYYTYRVYLNVNGGWHFMKSGRLDHTGHYGYWYQHTDSLPDIWYTVYTEVDYYDISGAYRGSSTSGAIRYKN
jgi:hypothetical protein